MVQEHTRSQSEKRKLVPVPPGSSKIFEVLKKDHDKVKQMFEQFESIDDEDFKAMKEFAKEIKMELEVHAKAEQKAVYDVLKKEEDTEEITMEAIEEHKVITHILDELSKARQAGQLKAKMTVLKEIVNHHVEEEEGEMSDKAENVLSADEEIEMIEKFMKLKERFIAAN